MSTTMNNWTVNGTTQLNKRVDVTDEVYVSNKKLKPLATSAEYNDLVNTPLTKDVNAVAQPPVTPSSALVAGYEFTSSSESTGREAYKAFGKNIFPFAEPNRWVSRNLKYQTNGSYGGTVTTNTSGGPVTGEWIQIKLPSMFRARSWFYNFGYVITTLNTVVCGSTDGVNFTILGFGNIQTRNVYNNLPAPGDYTYYRVVVTANTNYDSTSLWYVHFLSSNPNADWSATGGAAQILNKPTIPVQVNADWNAASGAAQILNKPAVAAFTGWIPLAVNSPYSGNLAINKLGEIVIFSGTIANSGGTTTSGLTIATLPVGYRPSLNTAIGAVAMDRTGRSMYISVSTAGAMYLYGPNNGTVLPTLSLEGLQLSTW